MAVTVVNLSDAVSAWVTKTNTIASNVGDLALLTTDSSGSLVAAINEINGQLDRDINDSAEIISLAKSGLQGSTTITFDSAAGQFSVPNDGITEAKIANDAVGQDQMKTLSTLLIIDSTGTTVKTLHAAGA